MRTKVEYIVIWRWRSETAVYREEVKASNADVAIREVVKRIREEYSVNQRRDIVVLGAYRFEDDFLAYFR